MGDNRILVNTVSTAWSSNLAYAIGLIASDGNLRKDSTEIAFSSRDEELVTRFRQSIGLQKSIVRTTPSGTSGRRGWALRFKSRQFYDFLLTIGITPKKSKTLGPLIIPSEYFADFLRGVFDGDVTFYTWWDKRWKNSFVFHIEIASASEKFLYWLQSCLNELYCTRGYIKRGNGVSILRFSKGDTKLLAQHMYANTNSLFLQRKYDKLMSALDLDQKIKQNSSTPR